MNEGEEVAPPKASLPAGEEVLPERPKPLAPARAWKPWLALAAAGVAAVLLWTFQPAHAPSVHLSASTQQTSDSQPPDAGTAAVGDTSPTVPLASAHLPSQQEPMPISQELPPELRPGQIRPDEKGRCPGRKQVLINGGCWVEQLSMTAEACKENGLVLFKGRCYTHALAPPQKPLPTSIPAKAR
jgi:hypothetical protein